MGGVTGQLEVGHAGVDERLVHPVQEPGALRIRALAGEHDRHRLVPVPTGRGAGPNLVDLDAAGRGQLDEECHAAVESPGGLKLQPSLPQILPGLVQAALDVLLYLLKVDRLLLSLRQLQAQRRTF